jgi:hypothetical protein
MPHEDYASGYIKHVLFVDRITLKPPRQLRIIDLPENENYLELLNSSRHRSPFHTLSDFRVAMLSSMCGSASATWKLLFSSKLNGRSLNRLFE